jgi:HEAT repeat protein
MIPLGIILMALFVFQTPGLAETDEELLRDLREEVRTFGQDEWGDFGSGMTLTLLGEKAYPVLVEALSDSDPQVRANAADMLALVPGERNTAPDYVLEALRSAAQDPDPHVRETAASALESLSHSET